MLPGVLNAESAKSIYTAALSNASKELKEAAKKLEDTKFNLIKTGVRFLKLW